MASIKSRVNFWETFAPVALRSTIQFILTKILTYTQDDIKHNKKYRKIPRGFDIQGQDAKNLYRQSPMSKELNAIIPDMKRKTSEKQHCEFTQSQDQPQSNRYQSFDSDSFD
jgi:hypothetical protein